MPDPNYDQTFKNLDKLFRREAGCGSELDYTEQASWLLFLKYLEDREETRRFEAGLRGEDYAPLLPDGMRWSDWAAPKKPDGARDEKAAKTGDDLLEFVDGALFPHLRGFRERAAGPDTVEYKIGEIFGEIRNRFRSGYNLREAVDLVDELRFGTAEQRHELSDAYEGRLAKMGNAGRNGGEYYTPRPLIRAIVRAVAPKVGQTIYDPACGSAGFLCEAYEYLRGVGAYAGEARDLSTDDLRFLQTGTLHGKEKKSLGFVTGVMNLILHGVEAPDLRHTNTLTEKLSDVGPRDRFDVVLANPPFGGDEGEEVQQNFPIETGETAYLFLQHFVKRLKPGGRAGIVIKNTFLSNADQAATSLRKTLLDQCALDTVLDLPARVFVGAGVRTVVLFFTKGRPTESVWYYELDPGRSLGKTNPLNDADMAEFLSLREGFEESAKSWIVPRSEIDSETWDLSVRNPNAPEAPPARDPAEILDDIEAQDREAAELIAELRGLL